jgi:hypothetical protein
VFSVCVGEKWGKTLHMRGMGFTPPSLLYTPLTAVHTHSLGFTFGTPTALLEMFGREGEHQNPEALIWCFDTYMNSCLQEAMEALEALLGDQ